MTYEHDNETSERGTSGVEVVEYEGRTPDEAVRRALMERCWSRDEVTVEVIDPGSRALFGEGGLARVRVSRGADPVHLAETVTAEILNRMGLEAQVAAARVDNGISVSIQSGASDAGLTDNEGQGLDAIQHLVSRIVSRRSGERQMVQVDVDGYRKRRERDLRDTAYVIADQVRANGEAHTTEEYGAADRRVIHLALNEDPDITTYAEGDGLFKPIVVAPIDQAPPPESRSASLSGRRRERSPGRDSARRRGRPPRGGGRGYRDRDAQNRDRGRGRRDEVPDRGYGERSERDRGRDHDRDDERSGERSVAGRERDRYRGSGRDSGRDRPPRRGRGRGRDSGRERSRDREPARAASDLDSREPRYTEDRDRGRRDWDDSRGNRDYERDTRDTRDARGARDAGEFREERPRRGRRGRPQSRDDRYGHADHAPRDRGPRDDEYDRGKHHDRDDESRHDRDLDYRDRDEPQRFDEESRHRDDDRGREDAQRRRRTRSRRGRSEPSRSDSSRRRRRPSGTPERSSEPRREEPTERPTRRRW